MEEKRIRASALLSAGLKKKHISQMLDISLSIVQRIEKRMKNKESLKDCPRSSRPRAIDPAIVKITFLKNPTMKMSELAKKKKISINRFSSSSKSIWKKFKTFKKTIADKRNDFQTKNPMQKTFK